MNDSKDDAEDDGTNDATDNFKEGVSAGSKETLALDTGLDPLDEDSAHTSIPN